MARMTGSQNETARVRLGRGGYLGLGIGAAVFGIAIAIHFGGSSAKPNTGSADLIAAAGLVGCPDSGPVAPASPGLPALRLPCLGAGPAVRLAGLRGVPLVINVWAGPCPPCKREAPLLQQFYSENAGRVRLLGVVDGAYPDTVDDALSAAHGLGMRYSSLFDAHGELADALHVRGIPVTVFVGASGLIRHIKIGELHAGELEQLTATYLGVSIA